MREDKVRSILEAARMKSELHESMMEMISEGIDIKQRLTSSYGKERVQSTPDITNPVLIALEAQDTYVEQLCAELESIEDSFAEARKLIGKLDNIQARLLLECRFLSGWSLERIAVKRRCSPTTIRRKIDRLIAVIARLA